MNTNTLYFLLGFFSCFGFEVILLVIMAMQRRNK